MYMYLFYIHYKIKFMAVTLQSKQIVTFLRLISTLCLVLAEKYPPAPNACRIIMLKKKVWLKFNLNLIFKKKKERKIVITGDMYIYAKFYRLLNFITDARL